MILFNVIYVNNNVYRFDKEDCQLQPALNQSADAQKT